MAKYHIFEIQVKKADYRSLVSPQMMDKMQEQIMCITPCQYREDNLQKHPSMVARKKARV
jgi:hypothetical protein